MQLRLELQKAFDLKDWNLADRVLASLNNDQEVPVELAAGVRHLTNAAWRGRFTATDGTGRDEAGNAQLSPEELEQRAIKEGIALIKPRDKQLSGTNTNSLKTSGR